MKKSLLAPVPNLVLKLMKNLSQIFLSAIADETLLSPVAYEPMLCFREKKNLSLSPVAYFELKLLMNVPTCWPVKLEPRLRKKSLLFPVTNLVLK